MMVTLIQLNIPASAADSTKLSPIASTRTLFSLSIKETTCSNALTSPTGTLCVASINKGPEIAGPPHACLEWNMHLS